MFNKIIKSKIYQPYIFCTGKIKNIDSKYFIKKINEGCDSKDNLSHKTNVKGEMTSFKYFNNDIEFLKMLFPIFDFMDKETNVRKYFLEESWGVRNNIGSYTTMHDHFGCYVSGAIYLNSHDQLLEFPEINEKVKPEIGSFVIFTSFLKHGCKRNLTNKTKYGISFNIVNNGF
jgi:hypothetical protein